MREGGVRMKHYAATDKRGVEARFAEIDAKEPESPTQEDLEAIAKAKAESADDTVTLEDYRASKRKGTNS